MKKESISKISILLDFPEDLNNVMNAIRIMICQSKRRPGKKWGGGWVAFWFYLVGGNDKFVWGND